MIESKESKDSAGAEKEIEFTREQEAAITYRGGSLLVSAAAGSGKTRVLVERLLSSIDNDGASIDEFLIITYTRAAAFELREKIHDELHKRLARSPSNRLRRQTILCSGALIDTIHTICGEILRENAYLVGLPPDFRIADASESGMLMTEVADLVVNNIYNEVDHHPGFNALVDIIVQGRDDKQLIEIMLSVYNKLKSKVNYTSWLYEQIENQHYRGIEDISETLYGSLILRKLYNKTEYWYEEMQYLQAKIQLAPDFNAQYSESVDDIIFQMNAFKSALLLGWDHAKSKSDFKYIRPKPVKGYDDLKETRKSCIAELKKITAELEIGSAEHIKELKKLSKAVIAFYKLLIAFDTSYAQEKKRKGVADFSDLEHLTLELLTSKESAGKTEVAMNLSNRFKEIMIDEYQDINEVQELIFKAISKNETNIFMVGDVKQAIYRFRLADPSIFLGKYKKFKEYEYPERENSIADVGSTRNSLIAMGESVKVSGTTIHLSMNFRSQAHILNAINDIFTEIMSSEFGELDYTEREKLVPERKDVQYSNNCTKTKGKQGKKGKVRVDILDIPSKGSFLEEESPTTIKIEAEYIASEIKRLTDGTHLIPDKNGEKRPITPSDIVILLRSMKGVAWQFAAELRERGIESELPGGEGFFETIEISSILSLLSIIDNPHQDIPLAAFLTGPICKLTSDELAQLRIHNHETTLYEAIRRSAEHEKESGEMHCKCRRILDNINELRLLVADMPADRFIWHVYNKTGLLGHVGAMSGGDIRKRNLIALAESARKFETMEYKGLYGFLTYINKLQERGDDISSGLECKGSSAELTNAVKIMSIHKSKGLEFPVVFIANTTKQFNYTDIRQNVVFHSELGIGTMFVDKNKRTKHNTLSRAAIQTKLQEEMLSEELRVLYVAMTRAREKLILTAAVKGADRIIDKTSKVAQRKQETTNKIAPQAMMSLRNTLEWVLTGISASKSDAFSVNILSIDETSDINEEKVVISDEKSDQHENINEDKESENNKKEEIVFDSIYEYKYRSSIDLPSKLTVTGIVAQQDSEAEKSEWTNEEVRQTLPNRLPNFISEKREITGAERGILLHLIMQHIDFNNLSMEWKNTNAEHEKGSTEDKISSIEKELKRLVKLQIITEDQVSEINVVQLERFFSSELGVRLLNAENVKREFKFSILSPATEYYQDINTDNNDDKILIQGVIDCYFEEGKEIIVVDFKSDKVSDKTVREKAERYAPQLNIYAEAINRITGKIVKEKIIYFFTMDKAYNIE